MRKKSNATFTNFKWSKADHDLMVALLKEGKNYRQIAKCLGRSQKSIEQRAYVTRKTLRDSGVSEAKVAELLPTNPLPRPQNIRKRNYQPAHPNDPWKHARQDKPVETKPQPKPEPKPKEIVTQDFALIEKRLGDLLIAASACAIGVWFMVGILIASII